MSYTSFTLAHFSDVHLGPVTVADVFGAFRLKRLIGGASWHFRRKGLHRNAIADALRADVVAAKCDHVAFTGDLVNIAARGEFKRGLRWLQEFGDGPRLSFVPGNHDAYVKVPLGAGVEPFNRYMSGDGQPSDITWPFVRLRRNIAVVGVTSAVPQNLFRAGGSLGALQRNALAARLTDLGARGFYRVVLIHHPPLPDLAKPRKALTDAAELQSVLEDAGAELVLHGHNHRALFNTLKTKSGLADIIGVPSASMVDHTRQESGHETGHESAQWHRYDISRAKGQWQTGFSSRVWNGAEQRFVDGPTRTLGE